MTRIIKVESCIDCPFKVWAGAKRFLGQGYKEKYLCNKTLIGVEAKYLIRIDGKADIPRWCPLDDNEVSKEIMFVHRNSERIDAEREQKAKKDKEMLEYLQKIDPL